MTMMAASARQALFGERKMGCLYKITSPNGKSYIGVTSGTADSRWKAHVSRTKEGRPQAINRAIAKYGADSFVIVTLVEHDDFARLLELEREYIILHKTKTPNGYNLTDGGEGVSGRIITDAQRDNISKAQRKRFKRPDQREMAKSASKKAHRVLMRMHEENRIDGLPRWRVRKKEETLKAKLGPDGFNKECSRRISEAMRRPDVAEKIAKCARERSASPSWRAKISESKRGKSWGKMPDSTKALIAERRREEWRNPEKRAIRLRALELARAAKAAKSAAP